MQASDGANRCLILSVLYSRTLKEASAVQALSHLGSGAEISRKPIATASGEQVEAEDSQSIWARWKRLVPGRPSGRIRHHDAAHLDTVEALSAEQRDLQIDVGILPQPAPLVVALGMRLNEVANHAWDVRVGVDPSATVDPESAELLVELFGEADQGEREVRLAIPGGGIEITYAGTVTGNVTLDELRKVFPGLLGREALRPRQAAEVSGVRDASARTMGRMDKEAGKSWTLKELDGESERYSSLINAADLAPSGKATCE